MPVLGARLDDLLALADHVGEGGVHERGRVSVLAAFRGVLVAFLEDRIAIHGGTERSLQWFGTQFRKVPGRVWESFPIRDPEGVDQRRAELCLDTLAQRARKIVKECS
ncbi:hypothetical protein AB8O64_02635 [Streptomyces sp. QH1-20]|uniref:hypothetical protein n=1 Tax=Streptomyces sp. QH1-20 TaxID=3240934 RepID=UPI00351701B8